MANPVLAVELEFKPIEVSDISEESLLALGKMHVDYVKYSKDISLTVPQVFDIVKAVLQNPQYGVHVWFLKDQEKLVGFAITEIVPGANGFEMNLSQAYIAPGYRTAETQKLTIEGFEKVARDFGCAFITSSTRREPFEAYIRWMGRVGFKKRCVVMERDLRGGPNGRH